VVSGIHKQLDISSSQASHTLRCGISPPYQIKPGFWVRISVLLTSKAESGVGAPGPVKPPSSYSPWVSVSAVIFSSRMVVLKQRKALRINVVICEVLSTRQHAFNLDKTTLTAPGFPRTRKASKQRFGDNESLESLACKLDLFVAKPELFQQVNICLRARRVEAVARSRGTHRSKRIRQQQAKQRDGMGCLLLKTTRS
jgi:hypothetical protein